MNEALQAINKMAQFRWIR